ncbi:unnamed protein product [Rotaria sp. Silwood2]|nr:unnamed protein product [Rotaria sp. Silwood2]CAF3075385.1 unnamed protein product [Rotaria sp. Silwood2]CAF3307689.1 unnamed protein product [Rotaria sp. Silwood2]CAF3479822.1 unnamed protein product [Rotaria sp. Silwood2]CAF4067823.1 unnamed protein product [Rotaria sp. Silwood2]
MEAVRAMAKRKRIGFAAHNEKKKELIECLKNYRNILSHHILYGTGTTGSQIQQELRLPVTLLHSGPLGGDQEMGAMIAKGELDILIFLIDPLNPHPHIYDIGALVRLAQVYNIACETTTTGIKFLLTSKLMEESCTREIPLTGYPSAH